MIQESFVHCFRSCGLQNQTKFTGCFLEVLVDETQPYISLLAAGSSDPDYMSCWLQQGLGVMKSCFHHYSDLSYTIIQNIVSECVINKECVTCFMMVYSSSNQQCLQKFMRLFGLTPVEQKQAKDFFICSINALISLTAQC
ncbi:hypothetical protein KOW79_004645 [Hemibagrus wyckioides]|uniref:Uncharacterized protein n=1 Tax=Hemibagrus wyckioides TaxID=337641 RepID=A0A9D3SPV5_9TELE|nr:hypothetical protein KOW79_004645 [Hemibagrus wyckioides]